MRSWTGSLLSTPLAPDSGPGSEWAAGGAQLDGEFASTPLAANIGPGPERAVEGCAALAWSLPFIIILTGLSTGGQAILGIWSQDSAPDGMGKAGAFTV